LGDPARQLAGALEELERRFGPLRVAPFYRTEPVSPIAQPDYVNTVALGASAEPPEALLAFALELERRFGRERPVARSAGGAVRPGSRDAPRTLDVDLLFVGDERRAGPELELPHPRLRQRRFVLQPLADLDPDLALPPDGATVGSLLAALPGSPRVERLAEPGVRRP
jgi:2-amino-4-hydroxy-6-hydroxymethyldihydropteridine diphosphokinase